MLGIVEAIFLGGVIYGITGLGVFITFRILDFPDLTVDGSFPLGAVVMGVCLSTGQPLWLGMALAVGSGILAGLCTALIHNYLKVPGLLAGILSMIMLYSVNIRILGRPNLSLLNVETRPLFAHLREFAVNRFGGSDPMLAQSVVLIVFSLGLVGLLLLLLNLFFLTDLGIALGALGGNQQMAVSYGLNPRSLKSIGLGLSNGLVALSGALFAQYQGFADVGLGSGIIITGLAVVMMGEFCIRSNRIGWITFRTLQGAVLYQALIYGARRYGSGVGFLATDIKLLTGLLIVLFLGFSLWQKRNRDGLALKRATENMKTGPGTQTKEQGNSGAAGSDEPEQPEQNGEWL
ncbi:ABC transporter permease [Candidatus Haliotispira prima]|uniref:ABC transporter permease n=1 Tax=Candidatus Haliotispira prima TaxID=3034016 RepID=A0ABY8MGV9_9SPIO|nr:ABC transporter permease [Candidatus Haliotispira prima]